MIVDKNLYPYSYDEAIRLNEVDKWGVSHQQNQNCARFINKEVESKYDKTHDSSEIIPHAIEQFGFQRVNRVLAVAINLHGSNTSVGKENKIWAAGLPIYDTPTHQQDYRLDIDPGITDVLANKARQLWAELNLYSREHIVPESVYSDLTGKVLLIKPEKLNEEHINPQNQLFLATHGNGCNPTAAGTSVFGIFLTDGDTAVLSRDCLYGEIRKDLLPDWAREKLEMHHLGVTEEEFAAIDPTCNDPVFEEPEENTILSQTME